MTNCTNNDCTVKHQDNGEWRCFRCWRLFYPADQVEEACEQIESEEWDGKIEDNRE